MIIYGVGYTEGKDKTVCVCSTVVEGIVFVLGIEEVGI